MCCCYVGWGLSMSVCLACRVGMLVGPLSVYVWWPPPFLPSLRPSPLWVVRLLGKMDKRVMLPPLPLHQK